MVDLNALPENLTVFYYANDPSIGEICLPSSQKGQLAEAYFNELRTLSNVSIFNDLMQSTIRNVDPITPDIRYGEVLRIISILGEAMIHGFDDYSTGVFKSFRNSTRTFNHKKELSFAFFKKLLLGHKGEKWIVIKALNLMLPTLTPFEQKITNIAVKLTAYLDTSPLVTWAAKKFDRSFSDTKKEVKEPAKNTFINWVYKKFHRWTSGE